MDDETREGLNFLLTAAAVLAVVALLSALMLPAWLHGSIVYTLVVVVAALGAARGLVANGVIEEWGLEPLPAEGASASGDGGGVAGTTPKERVENRRARE